MYKDYEIKLNAILDKHGVQKVELGLVDDIEKLIKSSETNRKKLDSKLDNWYNKIVSVNKEFSSVSKLYTNFDKNIKELKQQVKTLEKEAKGLGIPVNTIPAYKNANADIKRADDMIAEFFEANNIAKKIKAAF